MYKKILDFVFKSMTKSFENCDLRLNPPLYRLLRKTKQIFLCFIFPKENKAYSNASRSFLVLLLKVGIGFICITTQFSIIVKTQRILSFNFSRILSQKYMLQYWFYEINIKILAAKVGVCQLGAKKFECWFHKINIV